MSTGQGVLYAIESVGQLLLQAQEAVVAQQQQIEQLQAEIGKLHAELAQVPPA